MARDIVTYRRRYRKLSGLGTTMKSLERDIDSATENLDFRNALALGSTSLIFAMIVVE